MIPKNSANDVAPLIDSEDQQKDVEDH